MTNKSSEQKGAKNAFGILHLNTPLYCAVLSIFLRTNKHRTNKKKKKNIDYNQTRFTIILGIDTFYEYKTTNCRWKTGFGATVASSFSSVVYELPLGHVGKITRKQLTITHFKIYWQLLIFIDTIQLLCIRTCAIIIILLLTVKQDAVWSDMRPIKDKYRVNVSEHQYRV